MPMSSLDRRQCSLWQIWLCAIVASFLCTVMPAAAQDERTVTVLDRGWRFFAGDAPDAVAPEFADADWEPVAVPHTWNRVGYYLHELGGSNRPGNIEPHRESMAQWHIPG
jgi:beta-galactosidase